MRRRVSPGRLLRTREPVNFLGWHVNVPLGPSALNTNCVAGAKVLCVGSVRVVAFSVTQTSGIIGSAVTVRA